VRGWFEPPSGEIAVEHVATFRFRCGTNTVVARGDSSASREQILHSFYATALPLIAWACDGIEAFHASAVWSAAGIVALCGPSESGKTTLAHALAARGNPRFAEDAVAFKAAEQLRAIPLPFTTNLRKPSSDFFSSSPPDELAPAEPEVGDWDLSEAPFAALVLLAPGEKVAPRLERLAPSEALLLLLPNAHRFKQQPVERDRLMLEAYLSLVADTPVLRLSYAQRFEQLDGVLDLLETMLKE